VVSQTTNIWRVAECCGNLERADETALVVVVNGFRATWVAFLERCKQLSGRLLLETRPELGVERYIRQDNSAKQRIYIKPRAAADDGKFAACRDVYDGGASSYNEIMGGKNAMRFNLIEQVVMDAPPLTFRDLARSDIKSAVHLSRIGGYDLTVEFFGKFDGKRALTRGCRAYDNE